jgi:hypothetical protein
MAVTERMTPVNPSFQQFEGYRGAAMNFLNKRADRTKKPQQPSQAREEGAGQADQCGRVEASHQVNTPPPTSAARQFDRMAAGLSIVVDARARASPSKLKSSVEQCFKDNIIRRE